MTDGTYSGPRPIRPITLESITEAMEEITSDMPLRNRPMNREEIEEVLEYLRHYSRPFPSRPEVELFGEEEARSMMENFNRHFRPGIVFFDEARVPARPPNPNDVTYTGPPPRTRINYSALMTSDLSPPPPPSESELNLRREIHRVPSPSEMYHNSTEHRYTTFDEAKHRVHYALKELGTPELVGLEWEPQATLLNHPNKSVHVTLASSFPWHTYDHGPDNVSINLPRSMTSFVDLRNGALELRSTACPPTELQQAIDLENSRLELLCRLIAEIYGPCALFLPANDTTKRICTKHYQASWFESDEKTFDHFYEVFQRSPCYGKYYSKNGRRNRLRVHINVPYEFTRYSEIEYAWFQAAYDIDYTLPPRLLCYSYTGEEVVSVNKLT